MRGLLQTRTTGIASFNDSEYNYDQIVFAEVDIRNQSRTAIIATMIQKAFPAPLDNRQQRSLFAEIKAETQFNTRLKLNSKLKAL
jgi:hypothetical protein